MSKFTTHLSLPDGCLIRTAKNGKWDLTLPDGRHVAGQAESETAAKIAATEEHKSYVYRQWFQGSLKSGQRFTVPLTE